MSFPLIYEFELRGYIKPAVRMTRRGKFGNKQAQEHLACKEDLAWQYKAQMSRHGWSMLPPKTPLGIEVQLITSKRLHAKDGDNLYKMITDSAEKIVFSNDSWIDEIHFIKKQGDNDLAAVKIWTNPLAGKE